MAPELIMRIHGTLIKWNDERGFGFVALPQSHEEIFVHISAFPRDGVRPRIGETISFEVRSGADGRKRAEDVLRPGGRTAIKRSYDGARAHTRSPLGTVIALIIVGALGAVAYEGYTSRLTVNDSRLPVNNEPMIAAPRAIELESEPVPQEFKCDGRTHCSQMRSCEEAVYFLQNCPGAKMDGNNDGEPCEQQWC
jgi:cold shock CspA family protein